MRLTRTSRWRAPLLIVLGGALAATWGTPGEAKAPAAAAMAFPGQAWEQQSPDQEGVDSAGLNAALEYLDGSLSEFGGIGTVFIVRNGYVIWAGPESDSEHQIFSATKAFTSTALGLLIQDSRASLSTLAKDIEPALAAQYPTVTLRHFATMTSGYDSLGGSYEFDAQGRGDSWNPGPPAPPIFPPGSKFRYWDDAMSQFGSLLTKTAGRAGATDDPKRHASPLSRRRGLRLQLVGERHQTGRTPALARCTAPAVLRERLAQQRLHRRPGMEPGARANQ